MTTLNPASQPYRILIAVAFDTTATPVLLEGMNLAKGHAGSELHIVHVAAETDRPEAAYTVVPMAERPEGPVMQLRNRLELAWQQTPERGAIAHIRYGDPAKAILQLAIDIGADVLVVGTHRRSGVQKLVLGSVAEQVLHAAHCPVLVVLAKDYSGAIASPSPEPPCKDCLAARHASANAQFWCARHSKVYLQPHIYVPRDQPRSSVLPVK